MASPHHESGSKPSSIDFDDTATAFASRSTAELRRMKRLFESFSSDPAAKARRRRKEALAAALLRWHLPVGPLIRRLGFDQFYGGENLAQARRVVNQLHDVGVRTVLDYSVESVATEAGLDATRDEVLRVIALCRGNPDTPFTVFKVTALAREAVLEEASKRLGGMNVAAAAELATVPLQAGLEQEFARAVARVRQLCVAAAEAGMKILVDAEHTWFQPAIDWMAIRMMLELNQRRAVVYNTLQMYRVGRLEYLHALIEVTRARGVMAGVKLVRGAYMEQERARAASLGQPSPIQPTRDATDAAYLGALDFSLANLDALELFVGTHSEETLRRLAVMFDRYGLRPGDSRVEVAQLYGMRDNASVMLAKAGYHVSKYVPYGPIREAFPYLVRRANENTSIEGQVGREVELLEREIERRQRP